MQFSRRRIKDLLEFEKNKQAKTCTIEFQRCLPTCKNIGICYRILILAKSAQKSSEQKILSVLNKNRCFSRFAMYKSHWSPETMIVDWPVGEDHKALGGINISGPIVANQRQTACISHLGILDVKCSNSGKSFSNIGASLGFQEMAGFVRRGSAWLPCPIEHATAAHGPFDRPMLRLQCHAYQPNGTKVVGKVLLLLSRRTTLQLFIFFTPPPVTGWK